MLRSEKPVVATSACSNCGSSNAEAYCPRCGERQPGGIDYSVAGLLSDAFREVTSLDGRLLRSLVVLLTKPGLLTSEWFHGHRGRYVKPFSLFLLLNVAFFLIQPYTQLLSYKYQNYVYGNGATARHRRVLVEQRRAPTKETPQQFEVRFNAALQDGKKSLLVFCIPVVALALVVLYAGRSHYFAKHIVFSIHTYAYLLIILGVMVPAFDAVLRALVAAGVPGDRVQWLEGDAGFSIVLAVIMGSYLYLAIRRAYGDGRVAAALRTAAIFYVIGALTNVYHDVLFYTTIYQL